MGYSPLPRARGLHRASGYPSRLPEPISAREFCGLKRGESGFGWDIPKTKNTPLETHSRGGGGGWGRKPPKEEAPPMARFVGGVVWGIKFQGLGGGGKRPPYFGMSVGT